MDSIILYKSRWIYPVSSPPIEGGVVALSQGRIHAVGKEKEVRSHFNGKLRDCGDGVILPALINAHTHLELSALRGQITPGLGFVEWVKALLALKEALSIEFLIQEMKRALEELLIGGTGAVGDWVSSIQSIFLSSPQSLIKRNFYEVLGFLDEELNLPDILNEKNPIHPSGWISLGAHAPHSTSSSLLRKSKNWTRERILPLSIHVSESIEEEQFLLSGNGLWREFLIHRGKWNSQWSPPGKTPVEYLDSLNLLDERTLCVHLTRAGKKDIDILRERRVRTVVCPRSNQFITGFLPDLPYMIQIGLTPAIGTDSLASNQDLNLWGELEMIHRSFPEIDPVIILRMATWCGAIALDLQDELGEIVPGKKPSLFFLPLGEVSVKDLPLAIINSNGIGLVWI